MKTSTTIIFVLVLFSFSEAQIKHDRTFEIPIDKIATELYSVSQDAGVVNFETLGTKLYFFDLNTWKMHLYNLDYSLLKTIDIQFQLNRSYFHDALIDKLQIMGLSQHLFDADDGVEFLVYIYSSSNAWPIEMSDFKPDGIQLTPTREALAEPYDKSRGRKLGNAYYAVVDDNGEIILALSGERISSPAKISNAPNGAKMFLPVSSYQIEVYSLPGKLRDQSATLTGSPSNHGDNQTSNNELVDLLEADIKVQLKRRN